MSTESFYHRLDGLMVIINEYNEVVGLHPIEVKADTDRLDERLSVQLGTHLLYFREANLVLGSKLYEKTKDVVKLLPTNVYVQENAEEDFSWRLVGKLRWHLPQQLSNRGTFDNQKEVRLLAQIYYKSLANQVRFRKEIPFTLEEKIALEILKKVSSTVKKEAIERTRVLTQMSLDTQEASV